MQQHCPFYPCRLQKSHCALTHFKEASGHTAILLWSPHAPSPLQNRWRSPVRGGDLHSAPWDMGLAAFCQLYIACPSAGGQSSCSSVSKHSLSKEQAPSACWAAAVRLLWAAPIQSHWLGPNSLRSRHTQGSFLSLRNALSPNQV